MPTPPDATGAEHVITIEPETLGDEPPAPDVGWRWLQQPEPRDGAWYRPTCSCGWRSKSVYTAQHRAERASQVHVTVNTPAPVPTRYWAQAVANVEDQTWSVAIYCQEHADEPLITVPAEGYDEQIANAMREHDEREHEEDRVV